MPSVTAQLVNKSRSLAYTFKFHPPKDGSILNYYFKAFRGKDIYGYASETFNTYVNPDTSRLSKLELIPSSSDTILLAAKSRITINLAGLCGLDVLSENNSGSGNSMETCQCARRDTFHRFVGRGNNRCHRRRFLGRAGPIESGDRHGQTACRPRAGIFAGGLVIF
jgi:hypothetical protein